MGGRRLLAVALLAVSVAACGAAAAQAQSVIPNVAALGVPFNSWHVQIHSTAGNDHVLTLTFDSPLLGQSITSTVYVPDDYTPTGPRFPVMYSLHGTVVSALDNCAPNPVTGREPLVKMLACGGGSFQESLYDIPSQLQNMHFLVVSPDTSPTHSICETCVWINGLHDVMPNFYPTTAAEVPADSFLHDELYPLTQALFNVRSDRGGRGVMGFSMGAWAAALQDMIHPDKYAYLGWVSGGYDIEEPTMEAGLEALGYLRDQGYGASPLVEPYWWAQYDPMDIATNIRGVHMGVLLSSGDGCLSAGDATAPECQGMFSPARAPLAAAMETIIARNHRIAVGDLAAKGIPFTTVHTPGVHGSNNSLIFAKYIVPEANAEFASHVPMPRTFSYRAVRPEFAVWGYSIFVTRPALGFLNLVNARTNGRRFMLVGNGTVNVTTPPTFQPEQTYTVTITGAGRTTMTHIAAGTAGSLKITVPLGSGPILTNPLPDNLGISSQQGATVQVTGP